MQSADALSGLKTQAITWGQYIATTNTKDLANEETGFGQKTAKTESLSKCRKPKMLGETAGRDYYLFSYIAVPQKIDYDLKYDWIVALCVMGSIKPLAEIEKTVVEGLALGLQKQSYEILNDGYYSSTEYACHIASISDIHVGSRGLVKAFSVESREDSVEKIKNFLAEITGQKNRAELMSQQKVVIRKSIAVLKNIWDAFITAVKSQIKGDTSWLIPIKARLLVSFNATTMTQMAQDSDWAMTQMIGVLENLTDKTPRITHMKEEIARFQTGFNEKEKEYRNYN